MSFHGQPVPTRSRWRRAFGGLAVFALFAGMLFWTKLRLVSDIPRSAYADPPAKAVDAAKGGATDTPEQDTAVPDESADSDQDGSEPDSDG